MPLPCALHPLHQVVNEELHARTFDPLCAPARVAHLVAWRDEHSDGRDEHHLRLLLERFGVAPPERCGQNYFAQLGALKLRWERHTEFVTYSFSHEGPFVDPFAEPLLVHVPEDWLCALPGQVVAATLLALEARDRPPRTLDELTALFDGYPVIGAEVVGGAGQAYSALRIHADGYGHILLRDVALSSAQAGRLVKRVLDIDTYRAMALLGLPLARNALTVLGNADRRLTAVAKTMTRVRQFDPSVSEREQLVELTDLASEIEAIAAQTTYRFEATRAYYGVIERRLTQLRQQRIEGLQTFSEFLDARLAPAVATCISTSERQHRLAERAARLTALLRARVEVSLQEQNRSLLDSMDRRARLQLRLQETVEGVSVIAISYYGVSLLGYLLKGLDARGYPIDTAAALGILVPLVFALTWLLLWRTKRRLHRDEVPRERQGPSREQ